MKACKHLDYTTDFLDCELVELTGFSAPVKYWRRTDPPYPDAPTKVQFCGQGRGRINSAFACYTPGEMPCYEASE